MKGLDIRSVCRKTRASASRQFRKHEPSAIEAPKGALTFAAVELRTQGHAIFSRVPVA